MSKVFISYRRDDSAGYAHAIHSQLLQHFSKDLVFMDVDTVEPGVDFVRAIEKAVGECDVLVAVIGKRWAGSEASGASRLDNAKDYVRLEVSTALARDIRVIPVLVDGMTMPREDSLPSPVQPITRRNAIEISNTRFNYDVDQLITAVRNILDAAKGQANEEKHRNRAQQKAEQRRFEEESERKADAAHSREEEGSRSEEEAGIKARKHAEESIVIEREDEGQVRNRSILGPRAVAVALLSALTIGAIGYFVVGPPFHADKKAPIPLPNQVQQERRPDEANSKGSWLIVAGSFGRTNRPAAEKQRIALAGAGFDAAMVDSNEYPLLTPNLWVVGIGPFESRESANAVLTRVSAIVPSAYIKKAR